MSVQDPRPGVTYEIEYRVISHSNEAAKYYFVVEATMFAFEETNEGELILALTQDCKEELYPAYRSIIDMISVDPDNIENDPRIESVEIVS